MSTVKRALISVSDKEGIVPFAKSLSEMDVEIISTGGTAKLLAKSGIPVTAIDSVTEFPEMMDGRVKTLHPKIHGALLGLRDNPAHVREAESQQIEWIDMVVVNLYPFEATIANPDVSIENAIENIDIGGPTMLRSAAKNYRFVTVVTDPADYNPILQELKETGEVALKTNERLAAKVFRRTADYDSAIDQYLSRVMLEETSIRLRYGQGQVLRYGENSHQSAVFYQDAACQEASVAHAEILNGKTMSFNNYVDADAALAAVKDLKDSIGVAVIKHTNPCGFATGKSVREALERAWEGDPISAFGSVIATNAVVDLPFASFLKGADEKHTGYVIVEGRLVPREIPSKFVEVIIAPDFTEDALALLSKTKTLRLLKIASMEDAAIEAKTYRKITGGLLEMDRDLLIFDKFDVVTQKTFDAGKEALAQFAYSACKHTKSNAIVLAHEYKPGCFQVMGMGAGQPNRVDSLRKLAVTKAMENLQMIYEMTQPDTPFEAYAKAAFENMVMASDAFFPFDDTVRAAAEYGIRFIVQPGGSKRDGDSIAACDELGMAMALTGLRHFRH